MEKKPLTFIFSQHLRAFTLWQFFLKESEALNCKLYWLSQLFGWVQTWHCCSIMDEADHKSSFHLIGICLTHIWPGTPRRKSLWAPVGSGWLSTVRTRIMAFVLLVCFFLLLLFGNQQLLSGFLRACYLYQHCSEMILSQTLLQEIYLKN